MADYPDPGGAISDPYPALSLSKTMDSSEKISSIVNSYGSTSVDRDLTSDATKEVSSQETGPRPDSSPTTPGPSGRVWRFPGRDGVGYGNPNLPPARAWSFQSVEPITLDRDQTAFDDVVEGRPKDNQFLQPMRDAERGFASLPDESMETDSIEPSEEVPSPRGTGQRSRGGGRRRGWKQLLKGTSHDPVLSKPEGRGPGRPRGRGVGKGRAKRNVDPGSEFRESLSIANKAYLEDDYDTAIQHALLAVQANPEIFQAHNLLSESLLKAGRLQDSIAALLCGAHTAKDPNVWVMVGDRTVEAMGDDRSDEDIEQALFCYSHAVKMNNEDYHARSCKLSLLIDKSDWSKARLEAKALCRLRPLDIDNKKQYAELCAMTNDPSEMDRAKQTYEYAFQHYHSISDSFGDPTEQWSHLNVYLELIDQISPADECIYKAKRLSRWFLGRKADVLWDDFIEDDREFDCDLKRRGDVPQIREGRVTLDRSKYGDGLPLEIRLKMGLFRLRMGARYQEEALQHLAHLLPFAEEIEDYYDMFLMVAEALKDVRVFGVAIQYYTPLLKLPDICNAELHLSMGLCYSNTGRYQEAVQAFNRVIEQDEHNSGARVQLAKMYEMMGDRHKALSVTGQAIELLQKDLVRDDDAASPNEPVRPRLPLPERTPEFGRRPRRPGPIGRSIPLLERRWRRIHGQADDVRSDYGQLSQLWDAIEDEEQGNAPEIKKWLECGTRLVKAFRSMDIFYPKRDRHLKFQGFGHFDHETGRALQDMRALKNRLERSQDAEGDLGDGQGDDDDDEGAEGTPRLNDSVPRDFHGIPFVEWHRIFVNLAFQYARSGEQEACYELIRNGMFRANIFYCDNKLHDISLATALCCAMIFNDSIFVSYLGRKYIAKGDFRAGMAYQLVAAVTRLSHGPNHFSTGPPQKYILRCVKLIDAMAMPPDVRMRTEWGNLKRLIAARILKDGDAHGTLDPGVLLHYGHQVSTSNQSWSALPYYLRAYALAPDSPSVLLSIAVMYIQNALKRQTENRHYGIAQGLSFLEKYYDLRIADSTACHLQEAEFNRARIWHMLGLTHLALPGYEKCLELSPKVQRELADPVIGEGGDVPGPCRGKVEDFAAEAAFALQQLYSLAGNHEAAMRVTEEWLVI